MRLTMILMIINIVSQGTTWASTEKKLIDAHAHIACSSERNGCYIGEATKKTFTYHMLLKAFGAKKSDNPLEVDRSIVEVLNQRVESSRLVKKVVLLALDGYVDDSLQKNVDPNSEAQDFSTLDLQKTSLFVPNDYILKLTKNYKTFLFGASINPNRKNAITLLKKAIADGAVLVKWIPNTMGVSPSDNRYVDFYKVMAQSKIPLLVHTGDEVLFNPRENYLGDPRLLELPLKLGVNVIAAHMGSKGEIDQVKNFEHFLDLSEKYSNLFSDCSGLTNLDRRRYVTQAVKMPSVLGKVLYGSDYPLNVMYIFTNPLYQIFKIKPQDALRLSQIENPFDRDVELKKLLGLRPGENQDLLYSRICTRL